MSNRREIFQRQILEAMNRHSTYLHRSSTETANNLLRLLESSSGALLREVQDRLDGLTPAELQAFARGKYTTTRLKGLRNTIDSWGKELAKQADSILATDLKQLAGYEANFAR